MERLGFWNLLKALSIIERFYPTETAREFFAVSLLPSHALTNNPSKQKMAVFSTYDLYALYMSSDPSDLSNESNNLNTLAFFYWSYIHNFDFVNASIISYLISFGHLYIHNAFYIFKNSKNLVNSSILFFSDA